MDLLVLCPWFPYPPDNGSRLRAFHLIRGLAALGHRVRLVAGVQGDVTEPRFGPLADACEAVEAAPWRWPAGEGGLLGAARAALSPVPRAVAEGDNPAFHAAVSRMVAARRPDAVLALELAGALFVPEGVPAVLDGVEVSAGRSGVPLRRRLTLAKSDRYWRGVLRGFAALTAVSDEEAAAVRALVRDGGPVVAVVPNGVDTAAYDPAARWPVPGRLLFPGSVAYGPNRDAVRWFARGVLPLVAAGVPDAHLLVTGRCPEDTAAEFAGEPRVAFTGPLPDLRPTLAEAAVCVVPLVTGGGGTRLKVLEAWAAGVPVVSTPLGAAGLGAENGTHLLLADGPAGFAAATLRLLRDPAWAAPLAKDGRRLVEERYDWAPLVAGLSGVLAEAAR